MPFRRRKTMRPRKRRKGPVRRRRFRRRFGPRPFRQPSAFPTNRVVKMRYTSIINLDPTGGPTEFVSYYFRANSIFDPDFTGTGHQPMGRDQWATFYNNYTVIGSKITVASSSASSNSSPSVVGVRCLDASSTIHTSTSGLIESPNVSYRVIQNALNGNIPRPVKATFSAKKWFNLTNIRDNQTFVGADMGSNPLNETFYQVFTGTLDNTLPDVGKLCLIVTVTYSVLFSDPKELAQS